MAAISSFNLGAKGLAPAPRARRQDPEPETRVGICCGCQADGAALFKIPNLSRYRCESCFEHETGYRHHLAPSRSILVLP